MLRDPDLADDACQETWLAAYRRDPKWQPPRRWLAEALRRIAQGLRRGEARRQRREAATRLHAELPTTAELVARSELQRRLLDLVLRLDEPLRTTTLLHYQDGWSVADIASHQGCPDDTVRWRLRRAVSLLREACRRDLGSDWRVSLSGAVAHLVPVGRDAATVSTPSFAATSLGVLMGSKTVVGVVVVGVGLGLALWCWNEPEPLASPRQAAMVAPAAAVGGVASAAQPATPRGPDVIERHAAPEPAASTSASVLVGRVVDGADQPVAGVRVQAGVAGGWVRQTTNLADGTFSLVVPPTPEEEVRIDIVADEFHTRESLRCGPGQEPPHHGLRPGVRDLGVIRLVSAGVVRGEVVDERGAHVAQALLLTYGGGESSWTGTDGRFRMPHVLPGVHELIVQAADHAEVQCPITVTVGAITEVVVTLPPGPQLRGRIVDEGGRGVGGVLLRPESGYSFHLPVPSAENGQFRIGLASANPSALVVEDEHYEQVDCKGTEFAPGTDGIRLTVREIAVETRFRFVDSADGSLVPRFRLVIHRHRGEAGEFRQRSDWPVAARSHDEQGLVVCRARPGIDSFEVVVPGFVTHKGEVRHDHDGDAVQTVRLTHLPGLTGRVLRGGEPVAGARVWVTACQFSTFEVAGAPDTAVASFGDFQPDWYSTIALIALGSDAPQWGCTDFGKPIETATTDANGWFTLGVATTQPCFLQVDNGSGPPLRRGPIDVQRRVELGDLELPRAVRVRGRLDLAVPGPLGGHAVVFDGETKARVRTADDGTFELDAAPGSAFVLVEPTRDLVVPWLPDQGRARYFLRIPDTADMPLVLPVANCATVRLTVTAKAPVSLEGAGLVLVPRDGRAATEVRASFSASGTLSAVVPALGVCRCELRLGNRRLWPVGDDVELLAGKEVEVTLAVAMGDIAIGCGTWPTKGTVTLRMSHAEGLTNEMELQFAGHDIDDVDASEATFEAGHLLLRRLPVGAAQVHILLRDAMGTTLVDRTVAVTVADGALARID